jgi:hypothetical protein
MGRVEGVGMILRYDGVQDDWERLDEGLVRHF